MYANLISIVFSAIVWFIPNYNYKNVIFRNIISATHASIIIATYLCFNISNSVSLFIYYISVGYYISDTLLEILDIQVKEITLTQFGTIAHHIILIIGLCFLIDPKTSEFFWKTYFLAELSNYPLYIKGHLHFTKSTNNFVIFCVVLLHATVFLICRFYCGFFILRDAYITGTYHTFMLMAFLLYLLSIVWFYKICQQTITKFKKLI